MAIDPMRKRASSRCLRHHCRRHIRQSPGAPHPNCGQRDRSQVPRLPTEALDPRPSADPPCNHARSASRAGSRERSAAGHRIVGSYRLDANHIACVAVPIMKSPETTQSPGERQRESTWHHICFKTSVSISATELAGACIEHEVRCWQERDSCLDEVARLTESAKSTME
jgi:hypothetical protein